MKKPEQGQPIEIVYLRECDRYRNLIDACVAQMNRILARIAPNDDPLDRPPRADPMRDQLTQHNTEFARRIARFAALIDKTEP